MADVCFSAFARGMSDESSPRPSFHKSFGPIFDKVQSLAGDDAKFHEAALCAMSPAAVVHMVLVRATSRQICFKFSMLRPAILC